MPRELFDPRPERRRVGERVVQVKHVPGHFVEQARQWCRSNRSRPRRDTGKTVTHNRTATCNLGRAVGRPHALPGIIPVDGGASRCQHALPNSASAGPLALRFGTPDSVTGDSKCAFPPPVGCCAASGAQRPFLTANATAASKTAKNVACDLATHKNAGSGMNTAPYHSGIGQAPAIAEWVSLLWPISGPSLALLDHRRGAAAGDLEGP